MYGLAFGLILAGACLIESPIGFALIAGAVVCYVKASHTR